jgi:UDP-glucose:tetrahydrobiopterin glucosyltransferase
VETLVKLALLAPLVTPILPEQHGGSQAVVADLAAGLERRGHEVTVFASRGSRIEGMDVHEVEVDSTELQDVLHRAGEGSRITSVLERSFALAYDSIGPEFDVVHNHGFDPPAITAAPTHTPVIHTLHLPPTPEMLHAIGQRRRLGSTFICVSQAQAHIWRRHTKIDKVILNGVPVEKIPWERSSYPYVMFAGRLSREKGPHIAIDVAAEAGIPISVAGPVYDEDYVRQEILPRAASESVTMCGHLSRIALWRLMSRAQAVVLPAIWDEPFGMVAAEAAAAGSPVVATRRGGLAEIVEEGLTGFFMDPSNMSAAADAIREAAILDRGEIRRRAKSRFCVARMASSYEEIYESVRRPAKAQL